MKIKEILKIKICLGVILFSFNSFAQEIPLKYGAQRTGKRQDESIQKFRENRLGQFIHWGLYAIPGGVWEGKTYPYAAEFLKSSAKIPTSTWDSLMYQFNPTRFNAKEWAKMAKNMGARYMTITTKHHEGFCLWPSKYTDFTITNTPYKKDILKEMVDAYNAEGLDVYFYYSVLDWHHPDWKYDIQTKEDSIAFSRLLDYCYNQLKELATNYPTVKGFWFDGTWDNSVKKNGWWTLEVEKMLKEVRPGALVNSRLRADDFGKRHFDSNGLMMGDYESGYERRLPDPVLDTIVTRRDWESCMTVPENQWGYHQDWSISYVKKPVEMLELIVHSVSMGGNILVNFGPQPDGDFRSEEKELAEYIGQWMQVNGEAIYGCDYAGLKKKDWGYYTKKGDKIYLAVFNKPFSNMLKVEIPAGITPEKAYTLSGNIDVKIIETAKNQYNIQIPDTYTDKPFIIVLKIRDGNNENKNYKDALT